MNEEQSTPGKATEAEQDTRKAFFSESSLQSGEESKNDKAKDDYYEVDNPKKGLISSIGDGEMRNEGTIGIGDIPEESPFISQALEDEQDKAELRDSGD